MLTDHGWILDYQRIEKELILDVCHVKTYLKKRFAPLIMCIFLEKTKQWNCEIEEIFSNFTGSIKLHYTTSKYATIVMCVNEHFTHMFSNNIFVTFCCTLVVYKLSRTVTPAALFTFAYNSCIPRRFTRTESLKYLWLKMESFPYELLFFAPGCFSWPVW